MSARRGIIAALLIGLSAALWPAWAGQGLLCVGEQEMHPLGDVLQVGEDVYFPAESLLTELGCSVFWHTTGRRLTVRYENRTAMVSPYSRLALVDGRQILLTQSPRFINGRLCVPQCFVERVTPLLLGREVKLSALTPTAPEPLPVRPFAELKRRRMLSLRKIVLDAGHGGHDPGAKSPQGLREKDINLAITLALAEKLKSQTDVEVVLTRNDDTFIPLPGRTNIANQSGADLFMSMHANGAYNRGATGFEVYFLSAQASDARAAALAAFENGENAAGAEAGNDGEEGGDLTQILRDMFRTENLAASERLAVAIQARLDIAMNMENRGVKQAPFFVLSGAQMPAVLVEVGFMSNFREAEILNNPETQKIIVSALYQAIIYYDAVRAASDGY
ncbi:MAG TPA: N-acetylmuramoyl-L-alanine amidase [bacterium]|nr:N-acetylmuramoyl-L-alanine amidase [bacterium]